MKKGKVIISLIMLLALCLTFTGCGKTETVPAPAQEAPAAAPAEGEAAGASALEGYPSGDISLLLKTSAGSGTDICCRLVASYLEREIGATIVPFQALYATPVVYAELLKYPADGHALVTMLMPSTVGFHTDTPDELGCVPDRDYKMVCQIIYSNDIVAVRADDERFKDCADINDLFQWCNDHPDETVLMGCNAVASNAEIATYRLIRWFEETKGYDLSNLVIVNASGGSQANTSFLGGNTDILMAQATNAITMHNDGSARVLGILAENRHSAMADVPTGIEQGIDVVTGLSTGLCVLPETDQAIVDYLSDNIEKVFSNPEFAASCKDAGVEVAFLGAEEYKEFVLAEQAELEEIWQWVRDTNRKVLN